MIGLATVGTRPSDPRDELTIYGCAAPGVGCQRQQEVHAGSLCLVLSGCVEENRRIPRPQKQPNQR